MATPKRNKGQALDDDILIGELYLQGLSYRGIAKKISEDKKRPYTLSHVQVALDMNRLLKEWRDAKGEQIDLWLTGELEKINKMEAEYWEQWEQSKEVWTHRTEKKAGTYKETTQTDSRPLGDVKYLQGVERCIEKRCHLLGLNKPTEILIPTNIEHTHFRLNEYPGMKKVG